MLSCFCIVPVFLAGTKASIKTFNWPTSYFYGEMLLFFFKERFKKSTGACHVDIPGLLLPVLYWRQLFKASGRERCLSHSVTWNLLKGNGLVEEGYSHMALWRHPDPAKLMFLMASPASYPCLPLCSLHRSCLGLWASSQAWAGSCQGGELLLKSLRQSSFSAMGTSQSSSPHPLVLQSLKRKMWS